MLLINITDTVREGQSITIPSTDKTYVFDVAGDTTKWNWATAKITYADESKAAIFLKSGDILNLDSPKGRITKIEAYYKISFRVVQ